MWLGVLRENRVDLQGAPAFTDWFVFCDFFVVAFTDLLSGSAISKYSLTDVHEGNRRDGVTSAACSGFQANLVVRLLRDLFFPMGHSSIVFFDAASQLYARPRPTIHEEWRCNRLSME